MLHSADVEQLARVLAKARNVASRRASQAPEAGAVAWGARGLSHASGATPSSSIESTRLMLRPGCGLTSSRLRSTSYGTNFESSRMYPIWYPSLGSLIDHELSGHSALKSL